MFYLKVADELYPAEFSGRVKDVDWDNRESKTIHFTTLGYPVVSTILADDIKWAIYEPRTEKRQKIDPESGEPMYDEDGEPIYETVDVSVEYDNSEYSMRGDMIQHPDGTASVKMGKPTDLEIAYEMLYGGNE